MTDQVPDLADGFEVSVRIVVQLVTSARAEVRVLVGTQAIASDICDPRSANSREKCFESLKRQRPNLVVESLRTDFEQSLLNPPLAPTTQDRQARSVPGRALEYEAVEPWSEPVELCTILDEVEEMFDRYVTMPPHAAVGIALWCAYTWAHPFARHHPRLLITAPTMRAGKSTLLRVLATVVHRPQVCDNMTVAVLFRVIDAHRPTILLDECDRWMRDPESSAALIGIVNSGHTRGGSVLRCTGDDFEPRSFATDSPTALAAIGSFADTIRDRSITIRLERRPPTKRGPRLDDEALREEMLQIRRKVARWVRDNGTALKSADPDLPEGLHERAQDNWRFLCAIGDAAGPSWGERARAAAQVLSKNHGEEESDPSTRFLSDALDIFRELGGRSITSRRLVASLIAIEDAPWSEVKGGRPLSPSGLAKLARPLGIVPRTTRIDTATAKGYLWDSFRKPWETYLAGDPRLDAVTTSQPARWAHERVVGDVTADPSVTVATDREPACEAECDVVTDDIEGAAREP